ncbi:MAG: methylated-DNA--[protein]-cysteine S-methyltransferase [Candidatus Palauibacterales bacterium]|nr:methylated-DNA--[protein]-cysteine S-methyltransferase [Candidatus Palauibacterales bacterium]
MSTSGNASANRATRRVETSLGPLAVTAGPEGVTGITWEEREVAGDSEGRRDAGGGVGTAPGEGASSPAERTAVGAARQLAEFLRGERRSFDLVLDLDGTPPFRRRVLEELGRIPYGETVSYGELAERCGRPGAARAVGNAVGRNPAPVVLPCHRVVRSDGSPGEYGGGRERKRRLLRLEGALPAPDAAPGPTADPQG